ncbi:MAG: Spermine synthase [Solirubrobacterales bacterium]|nr:Spermine synthase [Solirubrobacterales bacterium]
MSSPPIAPPRGIALVAFVVGAASLGAEIAAARLLAPWFGASTIVWANTIATVLVSLSAGYWLGGRLADRDPTMRGLCRIVLAAGVLLAVVPFVSGPFLRVSVDALDNVKAGAFVGSLVGVMVLLAVPVLLLGCVAPYAIRLSVTSLEQAGSVSGRLYAISTIGSLTGVFLAALLLVPVLGTRRTFLVFAVALALVALVGLRRGVFLAAPALLAALIAIPTGTVKAQDGVTVLEEAETEYQYARVERSATGTIRLQLNEGLAVHSLRRPGTYLTDDYWDDMLVLPWATRSTPPRRLAILGNAGGTVARALGHYFPDTVVDAVEIDGELSRIGRRWFDMRGPNLHVHTDDARPWLRRSAGGYDTILVDAYRQPYIPFYLATREFFELVRDRLAPGGSVIVNVGHPEGSDKLEKVLTATMRKAFPHVARDPTQSTNTMLVGSTVAPSAATLSGAPLPPELRRPASEAASVLADGLAGGEVYTDDRAPVEWLIDASIVKVAADGG